jgi:hypothetical protein
MVSRMHYFLEATNKRPGTFDDYNPMVHAGNVAVGAFHGVSKQYSRRNYIRIFGYSDI